MTTGRAYTDSVVDEVKRLLAGLGRSADATAAARALDEIGAALVEDMEAVRHRAALQAALTEL